MNSRPTNLGIKRTQANLQLSREYKAAADLRENARVQRIEDSIGAATSIVGAASYFNPVLAPVAAAGAIGYGTYKLGQSLRLW